MAKIADKFVKLKTSVGGNREKTGFEFTFGTPMEEHMRVTRPNRANHRILSELEFALHVSEEQQGRYDEVLEQALDFLLGKVEAQGVLTNQDCQEAEKILAPMAEEAKSFLSYLLPAGKEEFFYGRNQFYQGADQGDAGAAVLDRVQRL